MNRDRATSDNYRKPPVEHQFNSGKSGNPSGRLPKKKAVQPGVSALGGGIEDRLARMVLEEATRPVTVKEGDKVSELPAAQAVFRTMFRAAANGNPKGGADLSGRKRASRHCVGNGGVCASVQGSKWSDRTTRARRPSPSG
jgi:hypothetical protein